MALNVVARINGDKSPHAPHNEYPTTSRLFWPLVADLSVAWMPLCRVHARRQPWRHGVVVTGTDASARRGDGSHAPGPSEVVHTSLPHGRASPAFDVGPQARRAARNPGRDWAHRDQCSRHSHRRTDAATG